MPFQIHALEANRFQHLFKLSDDALEAQNVRRQIVKTSPGSPCRVSLEDARAGEEVLLLHHQHQPAATPYRAGHAIFVRKGAQQAFPGVDEIPELFRKRLISLRGFDVTDCMVDADVAEGAELEGAIDRMFSDPAVSYIHLHNAKPGCFAASVTRA